MGTSLTLAEVNAILSDLYACKRNIIRGESASYTIGTRSVQFLNLSQVNHEIREYEALREILEGSKSARGVRTVVPLDT